MAGSSIFRTFVLVNMALFASAAMIPRVPQGTQFVTGPCATDADCQTGCCAFTKGTCAGAVIAQQRDGGCGFGDGVPNNRAAQVIQGPNALAAPGVKAAAGGAPAPAAAAAPAAGGTQFITGPCANDGACASGCCGFNSGKCAGAIIALERDGGCGFGNARSNDDAARKLRGGRR